MLELAASDERVVAGAVVGSLAHGSGDRFSDLDLTFAVADGVDVADVLGDWTGTIAEELDAVHLFDLPSGAAIYRVFLLPGCLQLDLSFAPASSFGARGPSFRLLFGEAAEADTPGLGDPQELVGYAVHHALRARFCIERGRVGQAEYWVSSVRDVALSLACLARGLPVHHGRGVDALPADVHARFEDALVRSLERDELRRALERSIAGLLVEAGERAAGVEQALRTLATDWA